MIQEALSCLTDEINAYFKSKLKINEDKVVLSGIVNPDGSIAIREENKIIVTLVNVEKETVSQNGPIPHTSLPLNINLYILFSAYFASANYHESLRFLSFVMGYLQQKNVFTRSNTPQLDGGIARLVFEMENLTMDKMNNIWAVLGAKYMPSVMYKMRMLTIDGSIVREFRPGVSGISQNSLSN
jgi:Pvc16 N-terminal domain